MAAEHEDFYKRLRKKVHKWARSREGRRSEYTEYVLLAPDLFHLLVRLSLDKDVPVKEKAKLAVAVAYFLSPIDLLPEWIIGPIGYLDDVGLAVYVLQSILEETDEEVVTRHWAGDKDLLVTIRSFTEKADRMLGSGIWGRLRKLVEPAKTPRRTKAPANPSAQPTRSDAARATERGVADPTEKKPQKATRSGGDGSSSEGDTAKKTTKKAAKKTAAKKTVKKQSGDVKKTSKAKETEPAEGS